MVGLGACSAGGMCGGRGGHVWQERWPLQWTVRILLECILVKYDLYKILNFFNIDLVFKVLKMGILFKLLHVTLFVLLEFIS